MIQSVDLSESCDIPAEREQGQRYTVFDSFSGAGGVSRGAQMAGFKIQYAVDKANDVWDTYTTNFRRTKLYRMPLHEFISTARNTHIRVDVLHLSPPCQFFSPAHTREGAHDDENIFALFGGNQIIDKVRPRIITVEQTFGITHDKHLQYFRALIGDFTQFGYSVRWKIVRLCTWGAAQDRKRLVIIAAAPGESLPTFPEATHSMTLHGDGGLKPLNTIRRAIDDIRPGDDLHELDDARRNGPRGPSYDPERLAGTITTGGSELYYPDGTRDFTLREYASLQGFPKTHRFKGTKTSIKKQIGNAFPPNTVQVLYQHIEKWLLREDRMRPYQPPLEDVIMIDDLGPDGTIQLTDSDSDRDASPNMLEVIDTAGVPERSYRIVESEDEDMVIDLT